MPTPDDLEPDDLEAVDPLKPQQSEPRGSRRRRVTFQAEASLSYNSSLPPPEILAGYSRTQPDAPERILAMAERQKAHRQQMEKPLYKLELPMPPKP